MTDKEKIKKLIETKNFVNIQLGNIADLKRNFINISFKPNPNADVVIDPEKFPWEIPSNTADLVVATQVVEHIDPRHEGFLRWMDEVWRITKYGGQLMVSTPYAGSLGYWQDPSHINGCNEVTWYYFDPLKVIDGAALYYTYEPAPWKVENIGWVEEGNLEVLLVKMRDDKTFHASGKVKYE
jgi:SAM-dependent methyltransferase